MISTSFFQGDILLTFLKKKIPTRKIQLFNLSLSLYPSLHLSLPSLSISLSGH